MAQSRPVQPVKDNMSLLTEYFSAFSHFQRNARLYLISNALSGVTVGIILVLYNLYLVALGYRADFIGLVLFMGTLGAGIAIFPAGFCVDRFGGKAILIWASVLIGIAGTGQMLLRQPLPLLVSAFLAGIGAAFILVVNAPFLTVHSVPAERSVLFSLNIVVSLITTVLGEFLGGILPIWLRAWPWAMGTLPYGLNGLLVSQPLARSYQLALLIAGLIAAPSFIPLFMMSDDRPPSTFAATALSRPPSHPAGLMAIRKRIALWRRADIRAIVTSALFAMILVQILIGIGAGLFIPYLNIYFVQHLKASSALFGLIDGCANALNASLTLLAPLLALRISRINTLVFTRLLSLPLMLIIGLTGWLPLAAVLYPLREGLMDMSAGILQVFSMEVVAEQHRGMANSSYQAAYQAANGLATPIGGLIITRLGYAPAFVVAAVLYLAAITLLWERFKRYG
jgi:MFS family permease